MIGPIFLCNSSIDYISSIALGFNFVHQFCSSKIVWSTPVLMKYAIALVDIIKICEHFSDLNGKTLRIKKSLHSLLNHSKVAIYDI